MTLIVPPTNVILFWILCFATSLALMIYIVIPTFSLIMYWVEERQRKKAALARNARVLKSLEESRREIFAASGDNRTYEQKTNALR